MMADTTTCSTGNKALAITAVLHCGGGSENINSCAFNKQRAFRQCSKSKPPKHIAANR